MCVRVKYVLEISLAHDGVVRSPDLGDASLSWFRGAGVVPDEAESLGIFQHNGLSGGLRSGSACER